VLELIDSHCHLDSPQFDTDRAAVIARAVESSVTGMIDPGVDVPSSRAAVELAQQYESVYAAVGVHPHDAKTLDASGFEDLKSLAHSLKVVGIGEIGLDYYRDLSPRDVQRQAFQVQLELAAELGLPVIIHDRDAHEDVLAILRDWHSMSTPRRSTLGVLHSFSGDATLAESALVLGFSIGIAGPVTYKNSNRLREVVRAVPLERLLVETDAPYLAPHPHRGQRNEPAHVRRVAQAIADIKDLTLEEVVAQTHTNTGVLFGLAR
jgi:TatD DNase family protein